MRHLQIATVQPPSQESLEMQLRDLHGAANRLGLYDAADWLWRTALNPPKSKMLEEELAVERERAERLEQREKELTQAYKAHHQGGVGSYDKCAVCLKYELSQVAPEPTEPLRTTQVEYFPCQRCKGAGCRTCRGRGYAVVADEAAEEQSDLTGSR